MAEAKPNLTDEETKELKDHPVPCDPVDNDQLRLRQKIGEKLCNFFMQTDSTLTPECKAIYEKYPMWKFYTDTDGTPSMARRSYGVAIGKGGQQLLHMMSMRMLWINDVVGGVPCTEVQALTEWSPEHKKFIADSMPQSAHDRDAFLDPLGFLFFLDVRSR